MSLCWKYFLNCHNLWYLLWYILQAVYWCNWTTWMRRFCLKSSENTSPKPSCLIKVSDTKNSKKYYLLMHTEVVDVVDMCEYTYIVFSSPELKAQVSFSDRLSSVVCLFVRSSVCLCLSVCKLFRFSTSSQEPLGQFQPNLALSILGLRGFKFVQMKGPAFFQGEMIKKRENNLKNLLLQNHWANFNQTWQKASMGK